ncbi:hypothetical protein CDL15_Pgr022972 [Punica granatum]|uniref:Uncharacterized protein n=1 Tax=Punica granatum TaxID=22663 RepID=A0A218X4E8_PUNGR|nr:hypothetical protein CDL15_Pgr022972 [Punica granatum]
MLVTFAAGGKGHALFVGVVACDLLRREGWDSVSKFQGAGWEVFIVLIVVVKVQVAFLSVISCNGKRKSNEGTRTIRNLNATA